MARVHVIAGRRPALLGMVALVALPGSTTGASPNTAAALQRALDAARIRVGAPEATATVVRCGQVVWAGASGVQDLRSRRPATTATRVALASTTKTITATMIMQQVQRGRLSLDTRLSRFYPALPNARRITVRMLLNHTSGLQEYFDDAHVNDLIDNHPRHHWVRREVLAALRHPQFAPGARFAYTNSNYVVLGGILERLAHRSVATIFTRAIAARAGMTASTFVYDASRSGTFAHPYLQDARRRLTDEFTPGLGISTDYWGPVWTDGGLASTATDLARFGNALIGGRLVAPATLRKMTQVGPNDYGLGIYDQSFDGHRWLGHDGSYGGYESENWSDRSRNLTIAVTTDIGEPDSAPDTASDTIWRALVAASDRSNIAQCR